MNTKNTTQAAVYEDLQPRWDILRNFSCAESIQQHEHYIRLEKPQLQVGAQTVVLPYYRKHAKCCSGFVDGFEKIPPDHPPNCCSVVVQAIDSQKCCVVLGGRPPPVDESEKQLPRPTRCTLSQLRSGISVYLKSYMSILNSEVGDACPHCGVSPHITRHLFDCAARQTDLTPLSLRTVPVKAAIFLELDT